MTRQAGRGLWLYLGLAVALLVMSPKLIAAGMLTTRAQLALDCASSSAGAVRARQQFVGVEPSLLPRVEQVILLACPALWQERTKVLELSGEFVPQNAYEAFLLGRVLEQAGLADRAIEIWRTFPETATYFKFQTTHLLNEHACDEARRAGELAVAINPRLGPAYGELARVYTYCFRQLDQALKAYETAIALGEHSPTMWMAYAHTLDIAGYPVKAGQVVEEHQLSGPLALVLRANGLRAQQRYQDALPLYLAAVAQVDNDPYFLNGLAITYFKLGERDKALEAWQRALQLDPTFAPAKQGIASLNASQ